MITCSLKIKKNQIRETYQKQIKEVYDKLSNARNIESNKFCIDSYFFKK